MQPNDAAYRGPRNLLVIVVAIVVAITVFSVYRTTRHRTTVRPGLGPAGLQLPSISAPPGGIGCYYKKTRR